LKPDDLFFVRFLFVHQSSADGGNDLPGLDGTGNNHEDAKDVFDKDRQRPLRAGREETVIMWVDAHLEQSGDEQQTHAKPCNGFEPFLHGFDESKVVNRFECLARGGQEQEGGGDNRADPRDGGKQVKPVDDRQCPDRSKGHGYDVGGGTVVSAVGTITSGVGLNNKDGSGVAVGGKQINIAWS
jgi:hypothetical protein